MTNACRFGIDLVLQLEVLSRLAPVLMICEDAHWADLTSAEVLGLDRTRSINASMPRAASPALVIDRCLLALVFASNSASLIEHAAMR